MRRHPRIPSSSEEPRPDLTLCIAGWPDCAARCRKEQERSPPRHCGASPMMKRLALPPIQTREEMAFLRWEARCRTRVPPFLLVRAFVRQLRVSVGDGAVDLLADEGYRLGDAGPSGYLLQPFVIARHLMPNVVDRDPVQELARRVCTNARPIPCLVLVSGQPSYLPYCQRFDCDRRHCRNQAQQGRFLRRHGLRGRPPPFGRSRHGFGEFGTRFRCFDPSQCIKPHGGGFAGPPISCELVGRAQCPCD
jgi:hypothetical protein